ncbi:MAG: hypothetical protein JWQ53_1285 [Klenkia sp.]|nr:hypothetical protein [Klenkia sp.]
MSRLGYRCGAPSDTLTHRPGRVAAPRRTPDTHNRFTEHMEDEQG